MPAKRHAVIACLLALMLLATGCGPHAYLKDYFRANGGFAYMNPPSSLEGPGTIVQFQHGGMLTVYAKESAFKDVPVNAGDIQFADFDTSRQWRGSLRRCDLAVLGASTGMAMCLQVSPAATACGETVRMRPRPARPVTPAGGGTGRGG